MAKIATVDELWRYPVKSMAGEKIGSAAVGPLGIAGDRAWAVRDEVRGGIRGAKKIPDLMRCRASYGEGRDEAIATGDVVPTIALPDGSAFAANDASAAERVSAAVGHRITLWPRRPADDLDHYRRGAPTHADFETEMREIFAREPEEPLPDLMAFPPELMEYESPPGTYFDAYPLLLVTDVSLRTLQALNPASRVDVRRFRPNVVLRAEGSDLEGTFPEASWAGRRLRIGDAVLELVAACPRCVMVTHPFDDLPKDPSLLRTIVREAAQNFGVYAKIDAPGTLRLGDEGEWC